MDVPELVAFSVPSVQIYQQALKMSETLVRVALWRLMYSQRIYPFKIGVDLKSKVVYQYQQVTAVILR